MKKEDYYKALAEVKILDYQSYSEPFYHLMVAKGVMVKLESDLIEFLMKNKPTERSNEQQTRIDLMNTSIDHFIKTSELNMQLREMFIINEKWMTGLKQENAELKQKLSDMEYFNSKGGNDANGSGT